MLAYKQTRDEKGHFGKKVPITFVDWLKIKKVELNFEYDYELAKIMDAAPENVSRIFCGKAGPSILQVHSLIKNLDIKDGSPEYFQLLDLMYKSRLEMDLAQNRNKSRINKI